MRRGILRTAALIVLALGALLAPASVGAFPLDTCTLTVTSYDAAGNVLGTAVGGGPGGTRDDPLPVDPDGSVEWTGTTGGPGIQNSSYHVEIYNIPTPLQGSSPRDGSIRSSSQDSIAVGDVLPFSVAGVVYVSGEVLVEGQHFCGGSGWIRILGDPVGTPPFLAGAGLVLIGVILVLGAANGRHIVRGTVGGLFAGVGLGALAAVNGILPVNENTPPAAVIAGILVGLLTGAIDFGDLFGGGQPSPAAPPPTPAPAQPVTQVSGGDASPAGPPPTPLVPPTAPVAPPVAEASPPPMVEPPAAPPAQPPAPPPAPEAA
ncbi:MAG: hypothetical protein AB1736_07280, partial [Chloroflexota bacterium]